MRYNIKNIGEQGLDINLPITKDWLASVYPDVPLEPSPEGLTLVARLSESSDGYWLHGQLSGTLLTPCARCLEVARWAVQASVSVEYVHEDEAQDEDENAGREDRRPIDGRTIDLSDEIRDNILLALPIGPLCRPDCLGICSLCGQNRNLIRCRCQQEQKEQQKHPTEQNSPFRELEKLKL
jgi:uncharacterized protein